MPLIFYLFIIISLWNRALHLNKFEPPSPKDTFWQVWWKLTHWFLRTRLKCEKFTTTTTATTNNKQILIWKAHLNLLLRWAKNCISYFILESWLTYWKLFFQGFPFSLKNCSTIFFAFFKSIKAMLPWGAFLLKMSLKITREVFLYLLFFSWRPSDSFS